MRIANTQHLESIRCSDWRQTYLLRSPLNIPLLVTLLREHLGSEELDTAYQNVITGKKRSLPFGSTNITPKRRKTMDDMNDPKTSAGEPSPGPELIPAFCHVFEFRYSKPVVADTEVEEVADGRSPTWVQKSLTEQEVELETILNQYRSSLESISFDLGEVSTCVKGSNVLLYRSQVSPEDTLLVLPRVVDEEFDLQGDDYRSNVGYLPDFLYCCHDLRSVGKIDISTRLKVDVLPFNTDNSQTELPFRLLLELTVSLVSPIIFQGVPKEFKISAGLEQRQRRVLNHIFPSVHQPPATYRGETDIPFLYSILGPAPALSSAKALDAVQPAALLPTLLPFQRRSVAWMLKREGKTIDDQGRIVPSSQLELPLFWAEVELDDRKLYLHRLKGLLSGIPPESEIQPGGSLNEEPGLGKTVECIALILLNPGPGRNPSVKHWDEEVKVFVKQVKTTLIVTPPALAIQWADELKRRSPSLKIFVYEGWTKLRGPITEDDAKDLRQRRRETAIRRKKKLSRSHRISSGTPHACGSNLDEDKAEHISRMDVDNDIEYQRSKYVASASSDDDDNDTLDWCSHINTFDVCLTTYAVLQQDLTIARPPLIRPRREAGSYTNVERPRSPLVMCEWYRVIMDEVQMVGGGKTGEMVSLVPRVSSFAVSGTPARSQVSDLIHVLNFLRVPEITGSENLWRRLLKPNFVQHFIALFNRCAIRTSKDCVRGELTIPTQTRFLVPIELGRIERHVYDQNMEQALLELGYDVRGVAAIAGWQVDASLLRTWLRTLRGICTHPQVGQLQEKLHKPGVLKSIQEVLEGMKNQNWRNLMDDRKNRVQLLTRLVQLQHRDESSSDRYRRSLETLLLAENEANQIIQDLKGAMADHDIKGDALKKEAAVLKELRKSAANHSLSETANTATKRGKEKEMMENAVAVDDYNVDDLPKTPAGEEHAIKRRALQQRLRECYLVLHKVWFLKGDVYHVLGESHLNDEDLSYKQAEELRRNLLKSTEDSAKQAMKQIIQVTDKLTKDEVLLPAPYLEKGGIRSHDLMDEANELIEDVLNAQANLLWEWRTRLITLLTRSLSAESEDVDGEEYSRTLDTQGEAETFLQAYSALVADRREVLLAERTLLAAHDTREKKKRRTMTSKKADVEQPEAEAIYSITEDVELRPEDKVLQNDLDETRKGLLHRSDGRAIKSVMVALNGVAARIVNEKDPEKVIVRKAISALRLLIGSQGKVTEKLEADLSQFRRTFNERVLYFRQLQEISDSVAEVEHASLQNAIIEADIAQENIKGKIATLRARQRYLDNLAQNQECSDGVKEDDCCILCRSEFITGYVTQCAHVFCEGCLKVWLSRREGRICPVCRLVIDTNQLQRFSVKNDKADPAYAPARVVNDEPIPKSRRQIQYNVIDDELFKTIENIESSGSYGSKIQTLVRHLLHLQMTEPSSKSIVFSAWADSLHIIGHALHLNGIPSMRIDQKRNQKNAVKVFEDDPEIRVLLLHGERENAGLNIVCASRVFLVESVVNHAFEIQAIARIDRMGQMHNTQVYCYYAEDTVEKNILDLAARRGLSLYTKENSAGTLDFSKFSPDPKKPSVDSTTKSKKGQRGDFIFKTDDMLAVLFPHMYEDVEYLLPDDDDVPMQQPVEDYNSVHEHVNDVAGPSGLSR